MIVSQTIKSISEIINKYDIFLIDQWGVMHDGRIGYPHAIVCIKKLFNLNKKLIIISNSSRRKESTIDRLPSLGFQKKYFAEVITSGEMIWQELHLRSNNFSKKLGKNCYHLTYATKEDGLKYQNGLDYNFVDSLDNADFILGCTTSPKFTTLDYVPILEKAIKKNLPFICANPDFESVETSSKKRNLCMGTIAELYKDFGGSVYILGKPSIEIYQEAVRKFKSTDKHKILAIGDSIDHDIQGAINFGVDNMLITSGIYSSIFDNLNPTWDKTNNPLSKFDFEPTYLCSKFQF